MEDLISRQVLIKGLASIAKMKAKSDAQKALIGRCIFFIEHLPPVTPTRPKGKWNLINNFVAGEYRPFEYECSECGFRISMCRGLSQDRGHNLFCQHCGADMRGD